MVKSGRSLLLFTFTGAERIGFVWNLPGRSSLQLANITRKWKYEGCVRGKTASMGLAAAVAV